MLGKFHLVLLGLIDIVCLLIGQPVIVKLLLVTFTSRKTSLLNCNLALFHNMQYLISILHLCVLHFLPKQHQHVLYFLFVYVLIGGPMNLTFICLERYVAVIHPTSYPLLKKYRYREMCSATVWWFSVPTALARVYSLHNVFHSKDEVIKMIPYGVMMVMIPIIVWCSFHTVNVLRRSGPGRDQLHPAKKRAFRTICATSSIALFFYIGVASTQWYKKVNEGNHNCIVVPICLVLLSAASVVHPVCYLHTQRKLFPFFKCEQKAT